MSQSLDTEFRHEKWSSGNVFMLATIGAAVGLGNLWRFPFVAGQNGGAAFLIIYVGFVMLLGLPLMMAELAMGRRGGPITYRYPAVRLVECHINSRKWRYLRRPDSLLPAFHIHRCE